MKYYLAKFFRYIPTVSGMKIIGGVDNFNIVSVETDAALAELQAHPDNIPMVELTEAEATVAPKYYGETRGYRKAYSDLEGLTPDADELAKGQRKTKVYITPEITAATISLMKKAFKLHIDEEMKGRQTGKQKGKSYDKKKHDDLIKDVDKYKDIDEIVDAREALLGIEMSKDRANRLGKWDNTTDNRIGRVKFGVQF